MPINARLVYDGSTFQIPEEMGKPRVDQMIGTDAEKLCELVGRVCYDSLGKEKSRDSKGYHKHILEVAHTSTLEHFNFTIVLDKEWTQWIPSIYISCMNRKGVYLKKADIGLELTLNLRSALEWDRYSTNNNACTISHILEQTIKEHGNMWAPNIIQFDGKKRGAHEIQDDPKECSADQAFISMYLSGSRGWSHEQVRHRYAMSQRSTRYVDESESEWIMHPLTDKYLESLSGEDYTEVSHGLAKVVYASKDLYKDIARWLEPYLISKGVDRASARKQARGAARGYLGNALVTEMIFTAPVSGWLDMMRQRCSPFADAEIRKLYALVLPELKRSHYGFFFDKMNLIPSPDGIGQVMKEDE